MMNDKILSMARPGAHPPINIREAQQMLDRVPTSMWSGADGGFTTKGPDGKILWWFGDSLTADGFIHSSVLIQTDGLMEYNRGQIFPNDGEIIYWPSHAAPLDTPNSFIVPCGGIIPTADFFELAPMKMSLVSVDAQTGKPQFLVWLATDANEPLNGNASRRWDKIVYDKANSMYYVFATPAETPTGASFGVFVKSFTVENVESFENWTPEQQIVPYETDASWSPWIDEETGTWYALSMDTTRTKALLYSSDSAFGPWAKQEFPGVIPRDNTPGENVYVAHAHPEMTMMDGTLACTVSHSTPTNGEAWDYRIRFFAIPDPKQQPIILAEVHTGAVRLIWAAALDSQISITDLTDTTARVTITDGGVFTYTDLSPTTGRLSWPDP